LFAGDAVDSRAVGRGRSGRGDTAEVVGELFQWVGRIECNREVLLADVAQPNGVVEELAPHESPVGHPVFGKDVLVRAVEDAVAQVSLGGAFDQLANTVGVVGFGHSGVDAARLTKGRVDEIVA
jgi:hypothetical protein